MVVWSCNDVMMLGVVLVMRMWLCNDVVMLVMLVMLGVHGSGVTLLCCWGLWYLW